MTEMSYHTPVMVPETVDGLVTDRSGIYVDGTLGGGGHSTAILERLGPRGILYGMDQDRDALAATDALARLSGDARFQTIMGNFGYMDTLLPPAVVGSVSGILLDLGVSSHQINEAARGFSFQADGPLDMRMNADAPLTAAMVVNTYSESDLRRIFFEYGEERHSARIAREIVAKRPFTSTRELSVRVESVTPGPHALKSVARIFQAIRIEVNREMDVLQKVLLASLRVLKPGGRLAVLSYHSLEDRPVKRFMRSGRLDGVVEKDFYGNEITPLMPITRQPITPTDGEIRTNPRARSAKLRIAERKEPTT
jgi:16S rRNA (cytosine1402-N4)-methyltransferase